MIQNYPGRLLRSKAISGGLLFLIILFGLSLPVWASLSSESSPPETAETELSSMPDPPALLGKAQVSAGLFHSLMIHFDGRLFAFGDNSFGQLGTGIAGDQFNPVPVKLPDRAKAVSTGAYHSLVLTESGSVYAFGRNAYGQLGTGTIDNAAVPMLIDSLPPAMAIAAGAYHSLVLGKDGSVWVFGNNTEGQSGSALSESVQNEKGELITKRVIRPQKIIESGAIAITAGTSHSLILKENGQVLAFGANEHGQLGDGTTKGHSEPLPIPNVSNATLIAAGSDHSMIITADPRQTSEKQILIAFGDNSLGQIGVGSSYTLDDAILSPTPVDWRKAAGKGEYRIQTMVAGYSNSLLILTKQDQAATNLRNTKIMIWGNNAYRQLGDGGNSSFAVPRALKTNDQGHIGDMYLPIDDAAIGGGHVLLFSNRGLLGGAGRGDDGQLGPIAIQNSSAYFTGIPLPDLSEPIQIPVTGEMTVDAARVKAAALGDLLSDHGIPIALQVPWDTTGTFGFGGILQSADPGMPFFIAAAILVLLTALSLLFLSFRKQKRAVVRAKLRRKAILEAQASDEEYFAAEISETEK